MSMEHNIFKYATSELSQDAVICWLLSFYNNKNSKLYSLAKDLLSSFVALSSEDNKIEIQQQFYKTDILVYFPNTKKVIIIEDKTYTSEHDEQIAKYVEKISNDDKYKECKVYVVYFKTGFYYDNDKLVEYKCQNNKDNKFDGFKSIHGEYFREILLKYKNIDATLDMYIEYLDNLIRWYDTHGKFYNKNDKGDWNISKEYIAQYNLMREIFPEKKWNKDDKSGLYMIYSGSSFGRPWTEMKIIKGIDGHSVFWRIDTDKEGPYLSLRYYDWYDKKNNDEKCEKHKTEYQRYFECAEKACKVKEYCEVGKQENYFEATLLHIHINNVLAKWDENKDGFIKEIIDITNKFIALVNNQINPFL